MLVPNLDGFELRPQARELSSVKLIVRRRSTATMDQVFRLAVTNSGRPRDEGLKVAVRQACINPARAVGLPTGGLAVGAPADLVVLDGDLRVTQVLHRGEWVDGVAPST